MSEPDNSTVVARIEELKKAIAVQETLRGSIGDAVVDTTVGALKNQITELQARLSLSGRQRKQITVLFADLVGYTALSESIDPEDLGEIMNVLWSRVDQIILRYGGRIDKHIGDAVMALWGVESAREDDPANAVQAALSMHQQVRELCDTQFSKFCEHTESLALRIGVHTGPVLLGELGTTGEYTAVGDTVNTTNRLEQAAAPGSTFISHETYHQIRGVFEIRAIGKVRAKGKDDLLAYQVLSARPHAFHTITRGIVGVSTPMIGRESELNQLKSAISSVVNESCSKIVTIIGDPGVGKSRLLYEFQDWLDTLPLDLHHLRGRAAHQIMAEPYRLLRDLFSDYCGILDSDPASEARSKLEAGVSPFFAEEPQMKAHLIGALLGFDYSTSTHVLGIKDDPKQLRSRAIFYLLQWFAAFTDQKPTVLLLDDVHWADSASLEAIFHLISEQPGLKLLMICLARPVIFETFPQWKDWQPEPSDNQIQINLSPLTRQDSQHLVDEILKKIDAVPTELRDYIVSTAEGNPYYVEEIINKFIDDGVIIPEEGTQGWRLDTNSLDRAHVPLTLTAVLQSRLDGLPSNEKITMQQASIIGRDFWEDPLRLLQGDNPTLDQDLPSLEWCNLIKFQSDSLFRNTRAYSFKHTLMRDVAYETVLKRLRRKYHVQVAQWFIVTAKAIGRLEEFAAVIADHLTRAGDNSGAADWYSMAGARAMSQGALQEARILFDFALQGLPSNDHERRWQVLLKRDELFGILGNLDARKSDDAELLALALKAGNIDWVAEAYQRIGYCAALSGDETSAVEAYESALKAARESDNQRIQASVLPLMAVSLTHLGQIDAAGESAQKGLTIAETLGDDILLARAYLNTSIYYMAVGDLARATKMLIRQVEITQRVGNYLGEAIGLVNLGYNYVVLGQFTLGHAALLRSEKLTNAIGARSYCAYSRLNLGLAHFRLGDCLAAQAAIEKAIASLQEIQDKFGLAAGQVYWGMILEFCSEYLLAQEHFYIAKDLFREMDLHGYAMDAQAGLARCALQEGNLALASQLAQELWKYLSDQGIQAMEFPFRAYLTCAKVFNFEENIELAQVVAAQGYSELMKRADQISDQAWQKSYLDDISEHRELLAFWQELTTNR